MKISRAWSSWKSIKLWNYRSAEGRESLRLRKERRKIFKQLQRPQIAVNNAESFAQQSQNHIRRRAGRK